MTTMSHVASALAFLAALVPTMNGEHQDMAAGVASHMTDVADGPLRIERGAKRLPILVPRDEELVYVVSPSLGWFGDPAVGLVTITSTVKPYQPELLLSRSAANADSGETGLIRAHAKGAYAAHEFDDTITCALLPQRWPSLIHRQVKAGSENKQREVMLGWREGVFSGVYRRDDHCKRCKLRTHFNKPRWAWQKERHCKKCTRREHRVWRAPKSREFPEESVDMLGAVFLARSMLRDGQQRAQFPVVDKDELWTIELVTGRTRQQKVPAGTFEAVEVKLSAQIPEGEEEDEQDSEFAGLFGIHGTLSIWLHPSGVPVRIRGKVPFGPFDLDVSIKLKSYRGTPVDFRKSH